jgi:hypothetical protein
MMVSPVSHLIIYSHGYGDRKTSRGLFTAIAHTFPDAENIMFDYYPYNAASNTITVKPYQEQALKLRKVINTTRAEFPQAVIDLVCHAEGSIAAGIIKPRGIRKVILLSPPLDMSQAAVLGRLQSRSGQAINVAVRTRLSRSDGSTTVIHPEFWQGLEGIEAVKLYDRLSRFTQLRIINAKDDVTYDPAGKSTFDQPISNIALAGDLYFDKTDDRQRLLYILQKELSLS